MLHQPYPQELLDIPLVGNPWSTKPWEVRWLLWKAKQVQANILEIGTFKGETAVEFCWAFPKRIIHAVDLPSGGYIEADRIGLLASRWPNYRLHLIGDTDWQYDPEWNIAMTFIDGGHSVADCHKDTERALAYHRAHGGCIVWHDFTPSPPEDWGYQVHAYLCKRDEDIPRLTNVGGTSLVYLDL